MNITNRLKLMSIIIISLSLLFAGGCDSAYQSEYPLSGEVMMEIGGERKPAKNVEVLVGTETVTTDDQGKWRINGISERVDVELLYEDEVFSHIEPGMGIYEDVRNHRDNLDFTIVIETYSVSGIVEDKEEEEGIEGVEIKFYREDSEEEIVSSVLTDEQGRWEQDGLYGSVDIIAEINGDLFLVESVDSPTDNIIFEYDEDTLPSEDPENEFYTIEGKIEDPADRGIEDVELEITFEKEGEEQTLYTYTDEDGHYEKTGLSGDVTLRPEKSGYVFEPETREVEGYRKVDFTGREEVIELEGVIEDDTGDGVSDVQVQIKDEEGEEIEEASVETDPRGQFDTEIDMIEQDIKEVTLVPEKEDWVFIPVSKNIEISRTDLTFEAQYDVDKYNVSGVIEDAEGEGIVGVDVHFGEEYTPVTTNSEGEYSKSGLEGEVVITPDKDGYTFQPEEITVDGPRDDADFEAYKYEVSGTVEDADGEPVSGVKLEFTGDDIDDKETTTNSEGEYSFAGLRGEVDITPEKEGYSFQPGSIKVYGARDDADFTAHEDTYTVSGAVLDIDGDPVTGVEIKAIDGDTTVKTVTTNDEGVYEISGLDVEESYKLEPVKEGYEFQPEEITVDGPRDDADFEAKRQYYEVSGTVEGEDGEPVSGVKLEFTGDDIDTKETTTNSEGEYSFAGLRGEVDITPEKEGYTFQPGSIKVYGAREDADFKAKRQDYEVSGVIEDAEGEGIVGVDVHFGEEYTPVTTNSEGEYSKSGLEGEVVITPEKDGYTFQPEDITVIGPRDDADFEAYKYEVSGTVEDTDREPVSGVKLEFTGDDIDTKETTTNSEGEYSFAGLRGEVDITPEKEGYTFQPGSIKVYGARDDADFKAYEETYTAGGTVLDIEGDPVTGAEISAVDGDTTVKTVTSNNEGVYEISGLEVGESYRLVPEKDGYEFQPEEITVDGPKDDADFEATD